MINVITAKPLEIQYVMVDDKLRLMLPNNNKEIAYAKLF